MLPSVAEGRRPLSHGPTGRVSVSDEGSGSTGALANDNLVGMTLPAVSASLSRSPSRRRVQANAPRLSIYGSRAHIQVVSADSTNRLQQHVNNVLGAGPPAPGSPADNFPAPQYDTPGPPGGDQTGPSPSPAASSAPQPRTILDSPTADVRAQPHTHSQPQPQPQPQPQAGHTHPSTAQPPGTASSGTSSSTSSSSPGRQSRRSLPNMGHATMRPLARPGASRRSLSPTGSPAGTPTAASAVAAAGATSESGSVPSGPSAPATRTPGGLMATRSVRSAHFTGSSGSGGGGGTAAVQHHRTVLQAEGASSAGGAIQPRPPPQALEEPAVPVVGSAAPPPPSSAAGSHPASHQSPRVARTQLVQAPSFSPSTFVAAQAASQLQPTPLPERSGGRLTVEVESSVELLSALHSPSYSAALTTMPSDAPSSPVFPPTGVPPSGTPTTMRPSSAYAPYPHAGFPVAAAAGGGGGGGGADARFLAELAAAVGELQRRVLDLSYRQGPGGAAGGGGGPPPPSTQESSLRLSDAGSCSTGAFGWSGRTSVPGTLTCDPSYLSSIFSVSTTTAAAAVAGPAMGAAGAAPSGTQTGMMPPMPPSAAAAAALVAGGGGDGGAAAVSGSSPVASPRGLRSPSEERMAAMELRLQQLAAAMAAGGGMMPTKTTPPSPLWSESGETVVPPSATAAAAAAAAGNGDGDVAAVVPMKFAPLELIMGMAMGMALQSSLSSSSTTTAAGRELPAGGKRPLPPPLKPAGLGSLAGPLPPLLRGSCARRALSGDVTPCAGWPTGRLVNLEKQLEEVVLRLSRMERQVMEQQAALAQAKHQHRHRRRSDQMGEPPLPLQPEGPLSGAEELSATPSLQSRGSCPHELVRQRRSLVMETEESGSLPGPTGSLAPPLTAAASVSATARAVADLQRGMHSLTQRVQDMVLEVASARAQSSSCAAEIQVVFEQLRSTQATASAASASARQASAAAAEAERTATAALDAVEGAAATAAAGGGGSAAAAAAALGPVPALLRGRGSLGGSADLSSPRRWEVWVPDAAGGLPPPEDSASRRLRRLSVGRQDFGLAVQHDGAEGAAGGGGTSGNPYGNAAVPSRTNMMEMTLGRVAELEATVDGLRSKLNKGLALRVTRDELRESMVQLTLQLRGSGMVADEGPADPWAPSRTAQDLSLNVTRRASAAAAADDAGSPAGHYAMAGSGTGGRRGSAGGYPGGAAVAGVAPPLAPLAPLGLPRYGGQDVGLA